MKYDIITPMAACLVAGVGGWLGDVPGLLVGLFLAYCIITKSEDHVEPRR